MPSSKSDFLILIAVAIAAYWLGANSQTGSSTGVGGTRTDVATGINFPTTKSFYVAKPTMSLLGVGTRKRAILNIYSLGFFVSSPIEKLVALSSSKEGSSQNTCDHIFGSTSPKAVQLIFAMNIGPEKIAEAVSQLKGVEQSVRTKFHDLLIDGMGGGKMLKGESMTFEWKGSDTISATARGTFIGSVKDKALAEGVLSLYIGSKTSVSPSLLDDLKCR